MKKILIILIALYSNVLLAQDNKKVLFLGNSYTYVNDLPAMIKNIAQSFGNDITYDQNTPGGHTFQNHSTNTQSLNKIKLQNWDYVVLQAQSQEPSFSPTQVAAQTKPYAVILNDSIKANNICTETMFFMTWGRKNGDAQNCPFYTPICTYEGMQQRLRESYLEMTLENDASCAPVGMAWKKLRETDPNIELYSSDESHPSVAGTYLAACVFYSSIFHQSSIGSTFTSSLDSASAYLIQSIASSTVLDSLDVWHIDTNAIVPIVIDSFITACDSVEIAGNWYFNDTIFSDTTIINSPCNIEIINYTLQIYNEPVEIDFFEQRMPEKTQTLTGIIFTFSATNFDSLLLYNNDTLVKVFYSNEYYYTYSCGEDVSDEMNFTLIAKNNCGVDSISQTFYCGSLSSVYDLDNVNWQIAPNPSQDFITITFAENKHFLIGINDLTGREIVTKTTATRIDLSMLEKGIYFIVLYNEKGNAIGQKRTIKN
jgi:hypothetical protein